MKLTLESYDYEEDYKTSIIKIRLKDISDILNNSIFVFSSYKHWLKTGELKPREYFLTPESLQILLDSISGTKYEKKLFLNTSKAFLKSFPNFKVLKDYLEKIKSLPIDNPNYVKDQ